MIEDKPPAYQAMMKIPPLKWQHYVTGTYYNKKEVPITQENAKMNNIIVHYNMYSAEYQLIAPFAAKLY